MTPPENFLDVDQGGDIWAELRCGIGTASRAADIIAMKKQTKKQKELGIREETADRRIYRSELICERLTGQPYPHHVTPEMRWGIAHEQDARAAYELQRGVLVEKVGFIIHPTITGFGSSPDGDLPDEDGSIQIKCPATMTHLAWMSDDRVPPEHAPQLLAELACSGRAWIDFVSYDPRLPEHLQLFVKRFDRDEKLIAILEAEVVHFLAEVDQVIAALPQAPKQLAGETDQADDDEDPQF